MLRLVVTEFLTQHRSSESQSSPTSLLAALSSALLRLIHPRTSGYLAPFGGLAS